jgi:hypothetical protein
MRVLKAFLIAPLTAPVVYWLASFVSALADGNRRHSAMSALLTSFALVMGFGSAVSYAATIVVGGPLYWLLGRNNALPLAPAIVVGGVTGAIVSVLLAPQLRGEIVSIPLGLPRAIAMGVATGIVFWWLLRDPRTD